jgi:hypothetical protein
MTYSASVSRLGSEFDDFLFAPISEDRNGMLLSVLSALARLDIDPWQEAAKLAGLPGATATQRLASLIAELPDEPASHPDPVTIAARLIALLPRPDSPTDRSRTALRAAGAANHLRAIIYMYVIFMVCRTTRSIASRSRLSRGRAAGFVGLTARSVPMKARRF